MTSQEAAVKVLAEARAALDRLGKRALDPESTAKNVTPELVEETREFNAIAIFLDEEPQTLEDAIRTKLCASSSCSCRAESIADAVREHLAQKIREA